jgi:hypothetical protein
MSYQHKPGWGSAFKNDKKVEDWHSDYRGKIMCHDNKLYYLDITKKVSKGGMEFISVKIGNEVADQPNAPTHPSHQPAPKTVDEMADDLPF